LGHLTEALSWIHDIPSVEKPGKPMRCHPEQTAVTFIYGLFHLMSPDTCPGAEITKPAVKDCKENRAERLKSIYFGNMI
jgi:hypothetical protein